MSDLYERALARIPGGVNSPVRAFGSVGGVFVVGNIDTLVRPFVFRRYAKMHPFITVIGAFAFVPIVGLLGLLVGPLAISYFFELVRMYRGEYLPETVTESLPGPLDQPATAPQV